MKTLFVVLITFITGATLKAQSPVPDPDTLKPAKQAVPSPHNLPQKVNYAEDHIKITPEEVPAAVKQTLEAAPIYQGWQKARIFKNRQNGQFVVEITKGDTTKIFHLDQIGRLVNE
jgi:hypothetical protein